MSIFSVKKAEASTIEKLAEFKSIFTSAHEGASKLVEEIEEELQSHRVATALAKATEERAEKLKSEAVAFVESLSKFI
jgi:hypothetical protein